MFYDNIDDNLDPIDLTQTIVEREGWDFGRTEDQIVFNVESKWCGYAVVIKWSSPDQMLRLICTFELAPTRESRNSALYESVNEISDRIDVVGSFVWRREESLMLYRYNLILAGDQVAASDEQVEKMISEAVVSADRFYPAFQHIATSDCSVDDAMKMAIGKTYGRA